MKKILIVQAVFYENISTMLLEGATAQLENDNIDYEVITVDGALEIPPAINIASKSNKFDGFVALGCVIRGETSHYDIVSEQSCNGIMQLSLEKDLAIGNGILTVENQEQALARANPKDKNKGGFAAGAVQKVISLKEKFIR